MKVLYKIVIISFILAIATHASSMKPTLSFNVSGGVTDIVYDKDYLYISTTAGTVEKYSLKEKKIIDSINLPSIKDFMGDDVAPKIYCIDILDDNLLLASKAKSGFSQIFIYENGKLINIISTKEQKAILRTKWIDKDTILFATLSNQFYLYDLKNKTNIWQIQVSGSKFSHFVLNENRDQFLVADESGDLKLHSVKDARLIKSFKDQNLDNVFQVDLKKDKIITAGQDLKTVVYDKNSKKSYIKKSRFLIYSAALSPSSNKAAFAKYENNDIQVFSTSSQSDIVKLTDNIMTITKILFINEDELFVASDAKQVNYYKIK